MFSVPIKQRRKETFLRGAQIFHAKVYLPGVFKLPAVKV
jgi:hypothetical protein